mgnify:CR=1 FL=1
MAVMTAEQRARKRAGDAAYRQRNRASIRAYHASWREKNAEHLREYRGRSAGLFAFDPARLRAAAEHFERTTR